MPEMMRSGPSLLQIHKGFCRLLVALENVGLIHGVLEYKLLSKNKASSEIRGAYKQVLMKNCGAQGEVAKLQPEELDEKFVKS